MKILDVYITDPVKDCGLHERRLAEQINMDHIDNAPDIEKEWSTLKKYIKFGRRSDWKKESNNYTKW